MTFEEAEAEMIDRRPGVTREDRTERMMRTILQKLDAIQFALERVQAAQSALNGNATAETARQFANQLRSR